jgi:hypothetical protein
MVVPVPHLFVLVDANTAHCLQGCLAAKVKMFRNLQRFCSRAGSGLTAKRCAILSLAINIAVAFITNQNYDPRYYPMSHGLRPSKERRSPRVGDLSFKGC